MLEGLGGRETLGPSREPILNSSSTIYIALTLYLGFPGGSDSKESACNVGDMGSILGPGRSTGEGNGNPLQYSCQEHSVGRGSWPTAVPGDQLLVTQSCPTLCKPMDCCPPGSSVHEISQARILEWITISFSRGSSLPKYQTWVPCNAG